MTFIPSLVGNGSTGFDFLQRTRTEQLERFSQSPEVARRIEDFTSRVSSVQSVDDLLSDRALLRVALGAFGLDDDINNQGFLRQVLESDLSDSRSLANRLTDKRYLDFATAFNFGGDTANIPSNNPVPALQAQWDQLDSVKDLFKLRNERLLERSLAAFGLESETENSILLERVLTADVDDPTSIVNRLDNPAFLSFARAFQGKLTPIPETFLARFDTETGLALQSVGSADALLDNRPLLNTVLSELGLSGNSTANNRFLLESVLNSDTSDPRSFANRLGDPAFSELAAAFDFQSRNQSQISIYDFAEIFESKVGQLNDANALIENPELLNAALRVFGLNAENPDVDFLRDVLNSDLTDDSSFANRLGDPKYTALANAFGFGAILSGTEVEVAQAPLNDLVDAATLRGTPPSTPSGFLTAFDLVLASQRFFNLPDDLDGLKKSERVVESDPTQPTSLFNVISDDMYRTFYAALDLKVETSGGRTYPIGFEANLSNRYIERQFEQSIGEVDPNMRIALALERELETVTSRSNSSQAQWFAVLSSQPLRTVFETMYNLPASFGQIDIERQVEILQERTQSAFGTQSLSALSEPDQLDAVRTRFLNQSLLSQDSNFGSPLAGGYATALTVLRGG